MQTNTVRSMGRIPHLDRQKDLMFQRRRTFIKGRGQTIEVKRRGKPLRSGTSALPTIAIRSRPVSSIDGVQRVPSQVLKAPNHTARNTYVITVCIEIHMAPHLLQRPIPEGRREFSRSLKVMASIPILSHRPTKVLIHGSATPLEISKID